MRIIVAGGTGVIGRFMLPKLVKDGHEVFAMTKDSKANKFLKEVGVTPVQADALNSEAVLAAFQKVQPEVVIHQLTSLGSVNLEDNAKIRVVGTRNLVDASKAVGVKKIIAQSLAFTYEPGETPATEDVPLDFEAPTPRKINVDGVASLESAAAELPEYVILRYGMLYGPGTWYDKDGMIGQQVLKGQVKATDSVISFLHVEDAAQAAVEALKWPSGPINVVDNEPASGKEWLPVFASAIGAPEPQKEDGSERGERGASNKKAKTEYGWKPLYRTWRTGFEQSLKN
ncbi:NAD(P)-dependent oxidoreductase [Priestia megaterium]